MAVVAPSSPFPREPFLRGLAWLRGRYELRVAPSIFARQGFLAGSDEHRRHELAVAMLDPSVRAIVAARGGYGASRIAGALPWRAFAEHPSWIVGFSDVTALHVLALKHGVASVHGPNVTGLAEASPSARLDWLDALEQPGRPRAWRNLLGLAFGKGDGTLVGGNLALIAALAASGELFVPEGAVLLLEDVGERPYRVDRMLTSLRVGGYFARLSAIAFGAFTDCAAGPDGASVDDVLRERTAGLGIPVVAGLPIGHGERNDCILHGSRARVLVTAAGASLECSAS